MGGGSEACLSTPMSTSMLKHAPRADGLAGSEPWVSGMSGCPVMSGEIR